MKRTPSSRRRDDGVFEIATKMRARPWEHLRAWLARRPVYTFDFSPKEGARRNWEESERWQEKFYAERQIRYDLAHEHLPVVQASNEDRLPGTSSMGEFTDRKVDLVCAAKSCPFHWPCPTYKWAIQVPDFHAELVVSRKDAPTT